MSQVGELNTSQLPPPPPLPPPPSLSLHSQVSNLSPKTLNKQMRSKIDDSELNYAIKKLFSIDTKYKQIFYMSNTCLVPQLQDGPKCGLVALSIASSARENFVNVEDIFQTAVSLGFTKQGEMFSSESLALLAEKCCNFKTRLIKEGLNNHFYCIIKSLLSKCLLLVPYDADFNHSPCCKKGSKAHWAVIIGFLIVEERDTSAKEDNEFLILESQRGTTFCDCIDRASDVELPLTISIHEGKVLIGKRSTNETKGSFKQGKIYLIGLQGKSQHVGLWLFHDLAESNDNLVLFPASRNSDCYILPEGGLEEGLKGKAIILDYS